MALRAAADLSGTLADADALDAARRVVADIVDGGPFDAVRGAARPPGGLFSGITRGLLTPAFMRELGSVGSSIGGLSGRISKLANEVPAPGRPAVCTVQTQNPAPTIDEINRVTGETGDLNSAQQAQVDAVIGNLQSPRGLAALTGCPDDGGVEPVLPQPVRAPFDPNDTSAPTPFGCEIVGEGAAARCGRTLIPLASRTAPLDCTVQFENVAAATGAAETVTVTDVLDARLDPATFEVLASTADSLLTVAITGQTVTFTFAGIDLPPNRTPPEGQGAVTFRVSPRPGLPDGTEIRNGAAIVFDFNPAILTPEVVHVVRATANLAVAIDAADFGPVQVPIVHTVRVANPASADPAAAVALTVPLPLGTTLVDVATTAGACSGTQTLSCALGALAGGAEVLVTVRAQPSAVGPAVLTASAASATFDGTWYDNAATRPFGVTANSAGEGGPAALTEVVLDRTWPNPLSDGATLRFGLPSTAAVTLTLVDLLGREVVRAVDAPMDAGWHEVPVEARGLAAGVNVAVLRAGDVVRTRRVLVVR